MQPHGQKERRNRSLSATAVCHDEARKKLALLTADILKEWGIDEGLIDAESLDAEEAMKKAESFGSSSVVLLSVELTPATRQCSVVRLPAIVPELDDLKLNYFFERVEAGRTIVPLPYEWREAPLSIISIQDIALLAAHALKLADQGQGDFFDSACLQRSYTLPQLARAIAVAADLDTLKTPLFSIDTQWLKTLAFPLTADDFRAPSSDEIVKVNKILGKEGGEQNSGNLSMNFRKRKTPEQVAAEQDSEDHVFLVSAIAPVYDAYSPPDTSNIDDESPLLDGNALFGNVVYKNDKYHRQLGARRSEIL